jgi:hypothetical protein
MNIVVRSGKSLGSAGVMLLAALTLSSAGWAQEEAATEEALRKNPAWKPTHREAPMIQVGKRGFSGSLHNYCLNLDGNILACCGGKYWRVSEAGKRTEVTEPSEVRVYGPEGKVIERWPLESMPQAIAVRKDGTIYVAGDGRVLKLDAHGKVLASAPTPVAGTAVSIGKDLESTLKGQNRLNKQEIEQTKKYLEGRRKDVTGLAVTDQDVFVACPSPNDYTYQVHRFDADLKDSHLVVEKLRGCCGQMDIQARDGKLWIPHNARHQVECCDREGKPVSHFGNKGRVKPQDFGGCCEPKNLRFAPNGDVLAAESGPPTCIKRFTPEGKFLNVVALPKMKGDCVRVTVEVSPDGTRFYLLDTEKDAIRVFVAGS